MMSGEGEEEIRTQPSAIARFCTVVGLVWASLFDCSDTGDEDW